MPRVTSPDHVTRAAVGIPAALRSARGVGLVDAGAAALLYAVGWDRAFSFDASRTVAQFVATGSLGDVFGQDRFNNHPLLSFLDHLVYAVTGSQDERLLRALPIACGAAAVGLVAGAVTQRFGALAGHVAGATLAVNAMAVRQFREVRGYALVTLAAVVATLLLLRLLRDHDNPSLRGRESGLPPSLLRPLYAAALAVAVGTHLFALGLIPLHVLVVVGSRRPLARWLVPWGVSAGAGLLVQLPAVVDGLSTPPRHVFAPTFPLRLAANLLGGPAAAGTLVLVVVGWTVLRSRPWTSWCLVGTVVMVAAAWVAAPSWLDSRFFIWLAPATAVAAGAAVWRAPRLAALAAVCVAVQLAVLGPDLARSEVPNRTAATFVQTAQAGGSQVCALGRTRAGLLAYVDDVRVAWTPVELGACDVAVEAAGPLPQPLFGPACRRFAFVLTLPAKHPGAIFADQPLPPVVEAPADGGRAEGWTPTGSAPACRRAVA